MRIGVLSMQEVDNYGSFMQALGLKFFLETRGHKVQFVKIASGEQINWETEKADVVFEGQDYYENEALYQKTARKINRILFHYILEWHRRRYLGVLQQDRGQFDCILVGSDEVFNCMQRSKWGFSLQLLGDIKDTPLVISYAASCGSTNEKGLKGIYRDQAKSALLNICFLSVRDENTFRFVNALTEKNAQFHSDPVLVSDYGSFRKAYRAKMKYLLVYVYTKRIRDRTDIKNIQNFADRHGMEVIAVGGYHSWCRKNLLVAPQKIFSIFEQAEFVITDTFHGTIFSAMANTDFVTVVREENENKVEDLLQRLNFSDRQIQDFGKLDDYYANPIDFVSFNCIVEREKRNTQNYFKSCGL